MSVHSALARKARYSFLNMGRIIREQPPFKLVFIALFAIGLEAGLLYLFIDGFKFLYRFEGMGHTVIRQLFSLFFLGMGAMLVMSGLVTSYATLFRSEEIRFLLPRPFRIRHIVTYKFLASTALSSWAFFFIVIPFAGAYAWFEKTPVLFAIWTLIFSVPFLMICSAIGMLLSMLFVRFGPRGRVLKVMGIALSVAMVLGLWLLARGVRDAPSPVHFTLSSLVPGVRLSSNALLPSWWTAEGIMALARHDWLRGALLWCTLFSTAMVATLLVEGLGMLTFYTNWQRTVAGGTSRDRSPRLLAGVERVLCRMRSDTRGLIMKDIRSFLRDPMQWSQALIFFGLLALYFANVRNFHYHVLPDTWRNTVAFLNVFSVSAVVCSLASRFIFPQLSLEGQGFWILGLSPTSMKHILLTKFLLSLSGLLIVSSALMLLSASMLDADWLVRAVAVGLSAAISFAVCGLSNGLGAVFLDLKQRNPAAIVSGFGGTLNLALSLAFMLAVIVPFGLAFHMNALSRVTPAGFHRLLLLCAAWTASITAITTAVPLWLGTRALVNRDY